MSNQNDEQYMLAVKNGDLDAMVPLFHAYHVKLFNFFLRLTKEKETSEDLTQTVFSRMITYKNSFNPEYSFRSWMYQIARNVHINHYNKNRYLVSDYVDAEDVENHGEEAISMMDKKERHEVLYNALDKLPVEQREIIELSRFQDLKYEEIASITGNTVGAVKVKVHRAIKQLKQIYFQIA